MEAERKDAVAQLVRQDAVAELEDHKPGIQVSLTANCAVYCSNCQRPLRGENVKLLVTPPHELARRAGIHRRAPPGDHDL